MAGTDTYIEIVEVVGGEVVSDEMEGLAQCAGCGWSVSEEWAHCPRCGQALDSDTMPGTCEDVGRMGVFVCSWCGRSYVPVQLSQQGMLAEADWNRCPGCGKAVLHGED